MVDVARSFIKSQRLQWLGCIMRRCPIAGTTQKWKPPRKMSGVRSGKKWMNPIEMDLRMPVMSEWKNMVQDKDI